MMLLIPVVLLSSFLPLTWAARPFNVVNHCPDSKGISLYVNGKSQGTQGQDAEFQSTFGEAIAIVYSDANHGEATGARTSRAGFYYNDETSYYYIVKEQAGMTTGLSVVPYDVTTKAQANCATVSCDSVSCPSSYDQPPSSFPKAPSPPLFECQGSNIGFNITFCPERTFPPPAGSVAIKFADDNDMCLDVYRSEFRDDAVVQIFDCNRTPAQRWEVSRNGKPSQVKLAGTDYCLDAGTSTPSDGTQLKIKTCVANAASQTWIWGQSQIKLNGQNQCVDLTNGQVRNENTLQTWRCDDIRKEYRDWISA